MICSNYVRGFKGVGQKGVEICVEGVRKPETMKRLIVLRESEHRKRDRGQGKKGGGGEYGDQMD